MNTTARNPWKRGWPAQRPQREAERDARCRVVAFDHWAGHLGLKHADVASQLGMACGTLASWWHRWRKDQLVARPLGRPCGRSDPRMRNEAIGLMRCGQGISATAVQAAFPSMPRREVQNLHRRFQRHCRRHQQRLLHVLHWHRPGSVWAMDHVDPLYAIDGRWPYILAVRDLASGYQLAWLPVFDESAESTVAALEGLFLEHGPPLVLKSDNGPGFIAEETRRFLDRWQVRPLFSPPYTPEYNGACEAGNGALKNCTREEAACHGRIGYWTADDTEAARHMANEYHYLHGSLRLSHGQVFRERGIVSDETRAAFGRAVEREQAQEKIKQGYSLETDLGHAAQAAIDRVAIGRVLVEHDFLTFTRRSIAPPIKSKNLLDIS
jgi:transposase InsO family protein